MPKNCNFDLFVHNFALRCNQVSQNKVLKVFWERSENQFGRLEGHRSASQKKSHPHSLEKILDPPLQGHHMNL